MKKILILYGSYGGGHLSAAKSIAEYLTTLNPDLHVELVDCIEYINKYLNKISTDAYKGMTKNAPFVWELVYNGTQDGAIAKMATTSNKILSFKLLQLIEEMNPDLIISTHFFSSQMCAFLKQKGKINCKLATILTDYHIHNQWLYLPEYVDFFFVANSDMKKEMISHKIPSKKIYITGIPISLRFSNKFNKDEIFKEFDLDKISKIKDLDELKCELLRLDGVGEKVADCIALFSLHRFDVFPIDVWVRRVMNDLYIHNEIEEKVKKEDIKKIAEEKFKNYRGIWVDLDFRA